MPHFHPQQAMIFWKYIIFCLLQAPKISAFSIVLEQNEAAGKYPSLRQRLLLIAAKKLYWEIFIQSFIETSSSTSAEENPAQNQQYVPQILGVLNVSRGVWDWVIREDIKYYFFRKGGGGAPQNLGPKSITPFSPKFWALFKENVWGESP